VSASVAQIFFEYVLETLKRIFCTVH